MSAGRTYEEEQEAVTAAVISVMHSLMDMVGDRDIEAHLRIVAAESVFEYARATSSPDIEFDDAPAEGGESEDEAV